MIDFTKVTQRATLVQDGTTYFHVAEKTSSGVTLVYTIIASAKLRVYDFVIRANTPYYQLVDGGTYSDLSTNTASGTLRLYY